MFDLHWIHIILLRSLFGTNSWHGAFSMIYQQEFLTDKMYEIELI